MIKFLRNKCYPDWPKSATLEEWTKVRKEAKKKKLCYFVAHTVPHWFRVKGMRIHDIILWFQYRFQPRHKYHLIDTKLKPNYYEIETRIIHGMFSLLVDFVEREKAQLYCLGIQDDELTPLCRTPREHGLAQLDWEIGLTWSKEEMYDKPELIGKRTPQSISAEKIKELYLWWTETRPARKDPWEDDFFKARKQTGSFEDVIEEICNRPKEEAQASARKRETIEEAYNAEDTKMLHKLIDLRSALWS